MAIKLKWLLLIILVVIVLVVFIIVKALSGRDYKHYLILGDSIAEGYGLKNKSDRYASYVQSKYKISNKNVIDLSNSGMTAQELANDIKNDEYINAIQSSDLITISIGSNELLNVLTQVFQDVVLNNPTTDFEKLSFVLTNELQNNINKKKFENAISTYEKSWDEIISTIKGANKDITIVATEFYNPFRNISGLESAGDTYIKQVNNILHEKSNNESLYIIAPIYNEFNNLHDSLTNININSRSFSSSSFDPHPNIEGHRFISEKIIEALSTR